MPLAVHYQVMEHLGSLESTQEAGAGLCCCTVKCSEILAHIKLLYNPRVNKVFTHLTHSAIASGNSYASFVLSKLLACSIPSIASTRERTRAKHVFTWRQTSEFQLSNFEVSLSKCEVLLLDTAQREDVSNQQERKKNYEKGVPLSTICGIKWKNLRRIILSQKLLIRNISPLSIEK